MTDFAVPNSTPGPCAKCHGSGRYCWGAVVNGKPSKSGPCHSCGGQGNQTQRDIWRNNSYNRHKAARITL